MDELKHQLYLSDLKIKKYLRADEFDAVEREEYNRQLILKQMKAKDKARELYGKYHMAVDKVWFSNEEVKIKSKQCALIAVDEIISLMIKFNGRNIENNSYEIEFWQEVKKYISYE